jgi:site-specific recombinase XerD
MKSLAVIPEKEKDIIKAAHPIDLDNLGNPTTPEEAALWEALNGKTTYQQWINRRFLVENISKSTINGWRTKLSKLAEWKGTDYLADLTKKEAIEFKDYLLSKGHEGSAVKNIIGTLNGFWNWLIENDLTKVNVWNGLKKRLPDADKKTITT